jgi:hypothetical protein
MINLTDYPLLVFGLTFLVLWLSERIGSSLLKRHGNMAEGVRQDFGVILSATLTLLGLLIGFTFSMAISRYNQRKNYEQAERPTRLAPNTSVPICCLAPTRQKCVHCLGGILISVSCSMRPAIGKSFCRSMPILLNCRASCGPPSVPRLRRKRHQCSPWPFRA